MEKIIVERRKSKRAEAKFTVNCRVDKLTEENMWTGSSEIDALMLDLSDLGMAVVAEENVPLSTILSLNFTLINFGASGDNRVSPMEMTGEVRNNTQAGSRDYRLGVRFTGISEKDKNAITEFVRSIK